MAFGIRIIYTQPTPTAKAYFRRLQSSLRRYLRATQGIEEEQIMIERSEVEIIKGNRARWARPAASDPDPDHGRAVAIDAATCRLKSTNVRRSPNVTRRGFGGGK